MKKSFPVIHSVPSPNVLASEVVPGFNIPNVSECRFYSGGFNDTYNVKSLSGRTNYLQVYRKNWRTLPDIQYELDVLNHLDQKKFPATKPLPYKDGNFYCTVPAPEGFRYVVVFTEAPGPEISYTQNPERTAHQYGQAVAHMHNALDDFSSPHDRFHKDLDHLIDQPLKNIEQFLAHRPVDWAYLMDFAMKVKQLILGMPARLLEQGFCHGDLQGHHAKVGPDKKMTFFDFDCGGFGFRAYDLAVFLWCCRLLDAVEVRWLPYLNGYRKVREIAELDVQAIPAFVCTRYLWHMGVHTQNSPDWGCGWLNDEYFDKRLDQLRKVEVDYLAA
jgi:Ser/Thr protein kinase RdoA (MazF antagonist)